MKKILFASLFLVTGILLHGQGTITMNNNSATRITNAVTSVGAVGVNVAVYFSANTNLVTSQSDASLVMATNTRILTVANGNFIGSTRVIRDETGAGIDGGNPAAFQVRAWSGAFATYEEAYASALVDGVTLVGKSVVFHMNTLGGGPGNVPTQAIFGANKLNQFNIAPVVPEPSSIALGLLGLGAIALFRRRK